MAPPNNNEELFSKQLKETFNTELQLIDVLPAIVQKAPTDELKNILSELLAKCKRQKKRLQVVAEVLGLELSSEVCEPMQDLIGQINTSMDGEVSSNLIKVAEIFNSIQRTISYQIWDYGTTIQCAKILDYRATVDQLKQTLAEKKDSDQTLIKRAAKHINNQKDKWEKKNKSLNKHIALPVSPQSKAFKQPRSINTDPL